MTNNAIDWILILAVAGLLVFLVSCAKEPEVAVLAPERVKVCMLYDKYFLWPHENDTKRTQESVQQIHKVMREFCNE